MTLQFGRIASHMEGVAEVRRWLTANIPFTESTAGHDLFVKIGQYLLAGTPIDLNSLRRELPHTEKEIRIQLLKMMRAGLLQAQGSETQRHWVPTPRYLELLKAYTEELDHVYAVRSSLRQQQLRMAVPDAELTSFVELLFDHFHDLGWLYLHNFGAICFLMASLVQNVARLHGFRARTASGYVDVLGSDQRIYQLGGKTHVGPGQIAGHAYCVVEEKIIVDFGLGNMRRAYRRDFPWGLACAYQPEGAIDGRMALPPGEHAMWKTDWCSPDTASEFAKFDLLAQQMSAQYGTYFGVGQAAGGAASRQHAVAAAVTHVLGDHPQVAAHRSPVPG